MQRPQIKLPWSGWELVQAPIRGHYHRPTVIKQVNIRTMVALGKEKQAVNKLTLCMCYLKSLTSPCYRCLATRATFTR